jgi:hypothetical protein
MVFLIDPKDLYAVKGCTYFCKGVAFPMYGIPPCRLFEV